MKPINDKTYYEDFYARKDWRHNYLQMKLVLKVYLIIIGLVFKRNIRTVLDAGCGTGYHTKIFNELGVQAEGFDFAETAIEKAKAQFPECVFTIQDGRDLSYDNTFDLIFASGFSLFNTENKDEIQALLTHWKDFLNPKGIILIIGKTDFSGEAPTGWVLHTEDQLNTLFTHEGFQSKNLFIGNKLRYLLLIPIFRKLNLYLINKVTRFFIRKFGVSEPVITILQKKS